MTPLESLNAALKKTGGGIRLVPLAEIETQPIAVTEITAILDDWSVVAINDGGMERLHLVGNVVGTTKTRTTSPILRIDLKAGYALTLSESMYQLGTQHEGEPELQQVFALAQAIGNWREATGRPGFNYYH